jgi:hypothetical protein
LSKLQTQDSSILCLLTATVDDELIDNEEARPADFSRRVGGVRSKFSKSMRRSCDKLGITSGVTSFAVGPQRFRNYSFRGCQFSSDRQDGFGYRIAALGLVSDPEKLESQLQGGIRADSWFSPATVKIRQSRPENLRELVFGLSLRHPSAVDSEADCGLFRVEPWFLATPDQWHQHRQATYRMPLIAWFGGWREQTSTPLQQLNSRRQQSAAARLRIFLTDARPVFYELAQQDGRMPGRPALLEELRRRNIDVPDGNLAKSMVRILKEQFDGNATNRD